MSDNLDSTWLLLDELMIGITFGGTFVVLEYF